MELGRMLERIGRMLFNQAAKKGINAGIGKVSGSGKGSGNGTGKGHADLSPAERAELKRARETAKRARQAAKLTRRMGKF